MLLSQVFLTILKQTIVSFCSGDLSTHIHYHLLIEEW